MRRLYARRRQTLIDALDRHLPGQATISGESAGVFLLVRFASAAVPACATRRGVLMASTGRFYASNPPPHEFILRFARIDERSMREGIARLA
jgi:GntR family transcriptional regulator/MocR family aminotransferase